MPFDSLGEFGGDPRPRLTPLFRGWHPLAAPRRRPAHPLLAVLSALLRRRRL
jgi:hypothetical protein